ncbi:hypothetical protein COK19_09750 [Bacillus cereus]|uniref:hypothetical protein n=1 Tax=Bacillus cereus TaxID=1396 RepID=UPI000BF8AE4E|nr:hypothetical protein [Bacillus cereus]PFR27701.1 hypothetical protein COK19_09750 [Bacillus cereus]
MFDITDYHESKWFEMNLQEKKDALIRLEKEIASRQKNRPEIPIFFDPTMKSHELGGYSPNKKRIRINANLLLDNENLNVLYDLVGTIIHEGWHVYQYHAMDNPGFHPKPGEVAVWEQNDRYYYRSSEDDALDSLYRMQGLERSAKQHEIDGLKSFYKEVEEATGMSNPGLGNYLLREKAIQNQFRHVFATEFLLPHFTPTELSKLRRYPSLIYREMDRLIREKQIQDKRNQRKPRVKPQDQGQRKPRVKPQDQRQPRLKPQDQDQHTLRVQQQRVRNLGGK